MTKDIILTCWLMVLKMMNAFTFKSIASVRVGNFVSTIKTMWLYTMHISRWQSWGIPERFFGIVWHDIKAHKLYVQNQGCSEFPWWNMVEHAISTHQTHWGKSWSLHIQKLMPIQIFLWPLPLSYAAVQEDD